MPKYKISKTVTTFYRLEIEAEDEAKAVALAEVRDVRDDWDAAEWVKIGSESFIQGEGGVPPAA